MRDRLQGAVRPGAVGSIGPQDWGNLRPERSLSVNNIPHRVVLTMLWDLPFGRTGSAVYRKVVGGWQVNSITTMQSGNPFSLSANVTGGGNRPNVVSGVTDKVDNPTLSSGSTPRR